MPQKSEKRLLYPISRLYSINVFRCPNFPKMSKLSFVSPSLVSDHHCIKCLSNQSVPFKTFRILSHLWIYVTWELKYWLTQFFIKRTTQKSMDLFVFPLLKTVVYQCCLYSIFDFGWFIIVQRIGRQLYFHFLQWLFEVHLRIRR